MDPEVTDAMTRSFLGKLPPDVAERLTVEGERVDYPAGTTFYGEGAPPCATLVVTGLFRVPAVRGGGVFNGPFWLTKG